MGGGLDQDQEGWDGVMSLLVVNLDSLCRSQVSESVYCAWRIPVHLSAPGVQSCCTFWISASVCVWFTDPDLSRHHPFL